MELYESGEGSIGELSVIFRTQSAALISDMTDFFRLWHKTEQKYLPRRGVVNVNYALYDNKFCRSLAVPHKDFTPQELAGSISAALCLKCDSRTADNVAYIELFDELMKGYLSGRYSAADIDRRYGEYAARQNIII